MDCLTKMCKSEKRQEFNGENLETEEEYKDRWRSIYVIYFTMFLMSLGFSIVLTGVWPYLDKLDPLAGKEFMGYIVGANPFGQMIFSPLFGWWGNKLGSIRIPLLCALAVFTMASATYSSLDVFSSHVKYWMFGARFMVGVSSANIAVCRAYLSAATKIKERTHAVSMVSLAQVLGFIVGPALQAVVTPLGDKGFPMIGDHFYMNMYTAAGWINVIMGVFNFCMFLPAVFKEKRIAAKEVMLLQGRESEKETMKAFKPDYISSWTLIVAFFVLVFNFVLLETLGTSLTMDQFAWSKTEALYYMGILMSVGAIIACATFVAIGPLCKKFEERKVLLWGGFFLMVFARAICIPMGDSPPQMAERLNSTDLYDPTFGSNFTEYYSNLTNANMLENSTATDYIEEEELLGCPPSQEWCRTTNSITITQFLLGYGITSVGYPIGVTLIQTIFSKILGPRPQGVWMGLMTGSGCLSRVMGPVFVGYIYTRLGTIWTFGFTTVMMAVSMIWLWIVRDRLIPPDFEKPAVELNDLKRVRIENSDKVTPEELDKLTNGKR